MLDPQPTWTQERLDLLKSAFDAGLSCREIGDQIGVSRNAVIGKLSRLQWKREKMIAGPKRRAVARTSHRRTGLRLRRQFLRSVEIHEAPIQSMHTCSLFELSAHTCRWPVSSPGEENFSFCGSPPLEGLPYCPGHSRLAYRVGAR